MMISLLCIDIYYNIESTEYGKENCSLLLQLVLSQCNIMQHVQQWRDELPVTQEISNYTFVMAAYSFFFFNNYKLRNECKMR